MDWLDGRTFDRLLSFLTPKDACKLAVQSTRLADLVGASALLWKTWCEQDSPSLKTCPAREAVAAHCGAVCERGVRTAYKQLFRKLSGSRSDRNETF